MLNVSSLCALPEIKSWLRHCQHHAPRGEGS